MSDRTASSVFWVAVVCHAALWTLLPGFLYPAYKPDVIELQLIGREWVLASAKHPMLPAWLLELGNLLTGRMFLTPFLVSQLCVMTTLWAVWRLGRSMLPPGLALVPPLSMFLYWFFTLESTKYNQNIALTACWTLSILFVYESLKTGRTLCWIAAGLALGLAFHAKYTTLLLVATILLFFFADARARKTWKTPGPYLSTAVAFLVFLPHLVWAFNHGFAGTETAFVPHEKTLLNRIHFPVRFIFCELGLLLPSLLTLIPILGFAWKRPEPPRPDETRWNLRFLAAMILTPFLIVLAVGAVKPMHLNPDYGMPLWPPVGILLLLLFRARDDVRSLRRFGLCVAIGEAILVGAFLFQSVFSPYLIGSPRRFHFPMRSLGNECRRIWSEHADGPCPYVTGEWWLAGNAAEAMTPHPSVHAFGTTNYMDFEKPLSTWSTESDVNRRGGIILWSLDSYKADVPPGLREHFPKARILEPLTLPYETGAEIPPIRIGIAIVLPESESTSAELELERPFRLETPHEKPDENQDREQDE